MLGERNLGQARPPSGTSARRHDRTHHIAANECVQTLRGGDLRCPANTPLWSSDTRSECGLSVTLGKRSGELSSSSVASLGFHCR